jgi:hypothetical protein
MTATGQCAWWIRLELTEPSKVRVNGPRPREPTTSIWASLERSTKVGTTGENNTSFLTWTGPPSGVLCRAISVASSTICCACACRHRVRPDDIGVGGSVGPNGLTACTIVSGTLRIAASRAAQSTAYLEAGDPSTPTKMPE